MNVSCVGLLFFAVALISSTTPSHAGPRGVQTDDAEATCALLGHPSASRFTREEVAFITVNCTAAAAAYEAGHRVKRDLQKAAKYYTLACANEEPVACAAISFMVIEGKVKKPPMSKQYALDTLDEVCRGLELVYREQKLGRGCLQLGETFFFGANAYFGGVSFDINVSRARHLFNIACGLGDGNACLALKACN